MRFIGPSGYTVDRNGLRRGIFCDSHVGNYVLPRCIIDRSDGNIKRTAAGEIIRWRTQIVIRATIFYGDGDCRITILVCLRSEINCAGSITVGVIARWVGNESKIITGGR